MNRGLKNLRARFKSAMKFLRGGNSLAKRVFFSEKESTTEKRNNLNTSKDEIAEAFERGCQHWEEEKENSKDARRYEDRYFKLKAAEKRLRKLEARYKSLSENNLKDGRRVSKRDMYAYEKEINRCYHNCEEARRKVETARKKFERDKKIYAESLTSPPN